MFSSRRGIFRLFFEVKLVTCAHTEFKSNKVWQKLGLEPFAAVLSSGLHFSAFVLQTQPSWFYLICLCSVCSYLVVVPQPLKFMVVPLGQLSPFSCIFAYLHLNYFHFSSLNMGLEALYCRLSLLTKEECSQNTLDYLICPELFKNAEINPFYQPFQPWLFLFCETPM